LEFLLSPSPAPAPPFRGNPVQIPNAAKITCTFLAYDNLASSNFKFGKKVHTVVAIFELP